MRARGSLAMRRGYGCITMPLGQILSMPFLRKKNTGRSVLSSTLGQGSFHGCAIRCLSSCNVFSIDVFSCFLMVCNLTFPSTKTHQKLSERAKFPKFFWGGMPPDPPREECASHGNTPFQILPTPLIQQQMQV